MNSFFSPSKQSKGQGLVEYAIILALVAIVVIAVVLLMGPRIGNTYSSINNSLPGGISELGGTAVPTAIPTVGPWVFVANEGEDFNVPPGEHEIQYGADGYYYTQTFTGPTTVGCNNSTFGDPIFGTYKSCSMR
jgi:pilus assembly protein Flp/PilA